MEKINITYCKIRRKSLNLSDNFYDVIEWNNELYLFEF